MANVPHHEHPCGVPQAQHFDREEPLPQDSAVTASQDVLENSACSVTHPLGGGTAKSLRVSVKHVLVSSTKNSQDTLGERESQTWGVQAVIS